LDNNLSLATTAANALTIDPQAPCASPALDPYNALLNVRSGPGSNYPIVNQLRPGDIVSVWIAVNVDPRSQSCRSQVGSPLLVLLLF
jgi:hypothetical protein